MLSNAERKLLQGLARRRVREREGLFLAEGMRVAEELLLSSIPVRLAVISSALEDTPRGEALRQALQRADTVRTLKPAELQRLAGTEASQGVLLVAEIPRRTLAGLEPGGQALLLALDAVQDPGNLGTLVRSADAFGAAAVVSLPGTVDAWNPKVVRAAAGSLFRLPPLEASLAELVDWLRRNDGVLCAADAGGSPIDDYRPPPRCALLVGNEGAGISAGARAAADAVLAVPTPGPAESLNVAVAAGILLYLLTRGRDA
jgi:RNA methyltransferase, TrmH family